MKTSLLDCSDIQNHNKKVAELERQREIEQQAQLKLLLEQSRRHIGTSPLNTPRMGGPPPSPRSSVDTNVTRERSETVGSQVSMASGPSHAHAHSHLQQKSLVPELSLLNLALSDTGSSSSRALRTPSPLKQ